jgi:hypothetical protein
MSCQHTVKGKQTEFEFYQHMQLFPDVGDCSGPVTIMGFTRYSYKAFRLALDRIGLSENYLEHYDPQPFDLDTLSLSMCVKHWIFHARGISTIGDHDNNEEWQQLAYYMFRYCCLSNEWDYKEIVNYAHSAGSVNPD